MTKMTPTDPVLQKVVERIVSVQPRARIVLFGSRARGQATRHSDYDLIIVSPDLRPDEPPAASIRKVLRDVDASFDLIVLTPSEWEASRVVRGSVLEIADKSGIELHAAA